MSSSLPDRPHRIQMHFDVATDDQAAESSAAWQEIVLGERTGLGTAEEEINEIMERARQALGVIAKAIEEHPGTGQSRRLVRFLTGVYNGEEYPFDLTDLRALDTELANACIDFLNYDRLGKAEVTHLPGGGEQMQWFIAQHGIRRRLHLSSPEEQESRLHSLAARLDRELLKDALGNLLREYEAKHFGGLLASRPSLHTDRPLVHARVLADPELKPLGGAEDEPWSARGFEFSGLTCWEYQAIVLKPADDPQ